MMSMDTEVFVCTVRQGADDVPRDVARVRVDPSVTSIPARAFYERKQLAEVELCEGIVEIGESAFKYCDHSITKISIPSITLLDARFVSTMALKVLENTHLLAVSSPTLESRPSSP